MEKRLDRGRQKLAAVWVLALLCACASGGGDGQAASTRSAPRPRNAGAGEVVELDRLPQKNRQVLLDYGRGGPAWEAGREMILSDVELARFLVDNLIVEMIKGYGAQTAGEDERGAQAFARAQLELTRFAPVSAPVLVELLSVKDSIVAQLCSDTLVLIGPAAGPPLVTALDARDATTRRRACELAGKLGENDGASPKLAQSLMRLALKDEDWTVRAQAAFALGPCGAVELGRRGDLRSDSGAWRTTLEQCLADVDPSVAERAARSLVLIGDVRAVPKLIVALESALEAGDLRRVRAMQDALVGVTGARGPDSPRAWNDWWSGHQAQGAGRQ